MVKVKICGITREDDLKAAVDAGVDSLGFVVGVPSSQRNLQLSEAKSLIAEASKSVNTVAVTIFKNMERLKQISKQTNADYLQIHGSFPELTLDPALRKRIIGVVDARADDALELAVTYSGIFNSVLIDTAGDDGVGGTGLTHNWNLSRRIREVIYPVPLILAGGLSPENVDEAIHRVRPYGVDVSSGVERSPRIKDHEKMFEFVAKAKEARVYE